MRLILASVLVVIIILAAIVITHRGGSVTGSVPSGTASSPQTLATAITGTDAASPTAADGTATITPSATAAPHATPTVTHAAAPTATPAVAAIPSNAIWVGPGRQYATPCAAITAAQAGATIAIDAAGNGTYAGDVCSWSTSNLTIIGVNGRAHIDAAGRNASGKGIWVIDGNNTTIENVEFSGAMVPDLNGAGIRMEGTSLTLRRCYFHDNQDGILTNPNLASDITIETSEFARNGDAGDPSQGLGAAHNMYIGASHSFTLRDSYSHDANQGHLVKSRAAVNYILYNRLMGQGGTTSIELDLPNGGLSYVIGNLLEKGPNDQNPYMLSYGEEGATNANSRLYAVNNTFVDDRGRSSDAAIHLATNALVQNNISVGGTTFVDQASATLVTNCVVWESDARFANPSGFDYHLQAGSACIDAGSAPGTSPEGYPLQPTAQYVYDTAQTARGVVGAAIDAGAFEH